MSQQAPYATWSSPVSAEAITKGSVHFADIVIDPITTAIYHIESRLSEEGRNVLVNTDTGIDVVGKGWDVRTGVHEYGGTPAIAHDGTVYFSNFKDRRVYKVKEGGEPKAVTPDNALHRFAGFVVHPTHTHLLAAILEDHTVDTPSGVITSLVVINIDSKSVKTLIAGADFYACPKFSPDGSRLAWLQWFHPNMPWEGSEVHIANVVLSSDGLSIQNETHVAGEPSKVSAGFPSFVSNDTLIFTSDESGYINPWRYAKGQSEPLFPRPIAQEFGSPLWALDVFPYAIVDEEGKFALFTSVKDGRSALYLVDLVSGSQPVSLETPYVVVDSLRGLSVKDRAVVFIGEKVDEEQSIVKCTIANLTGSSSPIYTVLKVGTPPPFPKDIVSVPRPMTLTASSGDPIHVVYYPPQSPEYSGSNIVGELPPCIINVHGGPTRLLLQGLKWNVQYFTSRGLDVNYGGSSGYGRKYIDRLVGRWGIVDVQDCIEASQLLSSGPNALIDPKRVMIRGRSAGGYTTLAAIANDPNVTAFAAATSLYGLSDLQPLAEHTPKFESRYLFKLVGGTVDEVPNVYKERSPLHNVDNIVTPLLILQGDIDNVVSKTQAEKIYNNLKARGVVVEYQLYLGEGHGWRQEKTMIDALERELRFYEDVIGLNKSVCL